MSLILDALNRSRESSDQVPGLATQHYSEPEDEQAQWRRYLPWLALLAALLVIGWLLVERESGPEEGAAAVVLSPAVGTTVATAPGPEETDRPEPAPVREAPLPKVAEPVQKVNVGPQAVVPVVEEKVVVVADMPATTTGSEVADLYQKSAESAAGSLAAVGKLAVEPKPATPVEEARPAAALNPASSKSVPQEQPIDIEEMVLKAREEMENARLEEHSAPFIADLSQQVKNDIPTIFYERHDYSGTSSQSAVTLNGKKLKAGGRVGSGVKVEEILPDSVVLNHKGTQFRLRALNSWVNL